MTSIRFNFKFNNFIDSIEKIITSVIELVNFIKEIVRTNSNLVLKFNVSAFSIFRVFLDDILCFLEDENIFVFQIST